MVDVWAMTEHVEKEIADFFESHEKEISFTDANFFNAHLFNALAENQHLDPACKTPTKLCESGDSFRSTEQK